MTNKGTILVIDDDADMRELFVTLLQIKGYEARAAACVPPDILDFKPDVILLDFILSGTSGLTICKELKQNPQLRNIPVLMVSGFTDVKEKCLDAGAEAFILKPFEITSLIASINKAMNQVPVNG